MHTPRNLLPGLVAVVTAACGSSDPVSYSAPAVSGVGPVPMTDLFDSSSLPAADLPDVVNGAFKVGLEGDAVSGFATRGATAAITATFTFKAYP